jgi:hypothetical protein
MPIDAETVSDRPSTSKGVARSLHELAGDDAAVARSRKPRSAITNSSPPRRATRSPSRTFSRSAARWRQELVADVVAEGVVHELEAVEVDEQHREHGRPVGRALGHPLGEARLERRPVVEAREDVVLGSIGGVAGGARSRCRPIRRRPSRRRA